MAPSPTPPTEVLHGQPRAREPPPNTSSISAVPPRQPASRLAATATFFTRVIVAAPGRTSPAHTPSSTASVAYPPSSVWLPVGTRSCRQQTAAPPGRPPRTTHGAWTLSVAGPPRRATQPVART